METNLLILDKSSSFQAEGWDYFIDIILNTNKFELVKIEGNNHLELIELLENNSFNTVIILSECYIFEIINLIKCEFLIKFLVGEDIKLIFNDTCKDKYNNFDLLYTDFLLTELLNYSENRLNESIFNKLCFLPKHYKCNKKRNKENYNIVYYKGEFESNCENINIKKIIDEVLNDASLSVIEDINLLNELLSKNENVNLIIANNVSIYDFIFLKDICTYYDVNLSFLDKYQMPSIERLLIPNNKYITEIYKNNFYKNHKSFRKIFDFSLKNNIVFNDSENIKDFNSINLEVKDLKFDYRNNKFNSFNYIKDKNSFCVNNFLTFLFNESPLKSYFINFVSELDLKDITDSNKLLYLFKYSIKNYLKFYPPLGYIYLINIINFDKFLFVKLLIEYMRTCEKKDKINILYLINQIFILRFKSEDFNNKEINDIIENTNELKVTKLLLSEDKFLLENNFINESSFNILSNTLFHILSTINFSNKETLDYYYNINTKLSSLNNSNLIKLNHIRLIFNIQFIDLKMFDNLIRSNSNLKNNINVDFVINSLLLNSTNYHQYDEDFLNYITENCLNNKLPSIFSLISYSLLKNNKILFNKFSSYISVKSIKDFLNCKYFPYYKFLYLEIICTFLFPNLNLENLRNLRKYSNQNLFSSHASILNSVETSSFNYKNDDVVNFIKIYFNLKNC